MLINNCPQRERRIQMSMNVTHTNFYGNTRIKTNICSIKKYNKTLEKYFVSLIRAYYVTMLITSFNKNKKDAANCRNFKV